MQMFWDLYDKKTEDGKERMAGCLIRTAGHDLMDFRRKLKDENKVEISDDEEMEEPEELPAEEDEEDEESEDELPEELQDSDDEDQLVDADKWKKLTPEEKAKRREKRKARRAARKAEREKR